MLLIMGRGGGEQMDMPCNERAMWAKNVLFDSTDTTKMLLPRRKIIFYTVKTTRCMVLDRNEHVISSILCQNISVDFTFFFFVTPHLHSLTYRLFRYILPCPSKGTFTRVI